MSLRQGLDNMVALPKTILDEVRRMNYPSKSCTYEQLKRQFALHGYGQNKIGKWMQYFLDLEILKENSDGTLTCTMW